jgi:hypothetical protein
MISYVQYNLSPDTEIKLLTSTTKEDLIKSLLSLPVGAYFIEIEEGDYMAN